MPGGRGVTRLQHPILRCLEARAPAAVTIDDVHAHTGLSRRAVEAELEDLRLEGHPIVAGATGVRLTQDPRELAAYLEGRRRRAAAIHRGTMALRSTLRRLQAGMVEQRTLGLIA
jgi:biotin operon repressor